MPIGRVGDLRTRPCWLEREFPKYAGFVGPEIGEFWRFII